MTPTLRRLLDPMTAARTSIPGSDSYMGKPLGTVRVLAPDGRVLGSIMGLGGSTVSNAAFGGPDRKTLFITTASALYRIDLNVPGFPS
jgi:sugar lactone lactonase YvrE